MTSAVHSKPALEGKALLTKKTLQLPPQVQTVSLGMQVSVILSEIL